jgi:hypothetical protein
MLIALGAMTAGHWQGAHATPIGAESQDGAMPLRPDGHGNSANRYEYKFGITVNTLGQRFYDEGETKHSHTYAKTGRAVLAQPRGLAHQVFDDTGFKLFREGAYAGAKGFEANRSPSLPARSGWRRKCSSTRSRSSTLPAGMTFRSILATRMAGARSGSRPRNRTGRSRSRSRRSGPIRSCAGSPSRSGAQDQHTG